MKQIALTFFALMASLGGWAQDDVYFVPTQKALKAERQEIMGNSSYEALTPRGDTFQHDNWAAGRVNNKRDIDEYNRRGTSRYRTDTLDRRTYNDYDGENTATARIVRFRSPGVRIIASPYYYDYYDLGFYDPWFDDWRWGGWYGAYPSFSLTWGWNNWGSPWHYYGWYPSRYSLWYSPWYSGWGWDNWYYWPYHYNNWGYVYSRPRNGVYNYSVGGNNSGPGVTRSGLFGSNSGRNYSTRSGSSMQSSGNIYRSDPSRHVTYGGLIGGSRNGGRSTTDYGNSNTRSYNSGNTYTPPVRSGSYDGSSRGGSYSGGGGGLFGGGSRSGGSSGGGSRGSGSIIGGRR